MGPLVPEIFSNEFNYIIAIVIGFFFGFVLEQAGFSSSKKLAGLFYGYDFVVLRVFFTAGITAMIGVLLFGYLGWLDLSAIYINPTFLYSAIIGGLIMGLGFIIGGFCPGTSVAAAAIGKIDAMVFVLGSAIGVLFFGEFYDVFEPIYNGWDYGELRIETVFGISPGLFGFMMILVALFAFIFTSRIENRVNKIPKSNLSFFKQEHNKFIPYAMIFVVLGVVLLILPSYEQKLMGEINEYATENSQKLKTIEPLEVAFRVLNEDNSLIVIDLREKLDSSKSLIPGAYNMPFDKILSKETTNLIIKSPKTVVFVDEDGKNSLKAVAYSNIMNFDNAYAMKGGIEAFDKSLVYNENEIPDKYDYNKIAEIKFKKEAPLKLKELKEKLALMSAPPKKVVRKKAGGC